MYDANFKNEVSDVYETLSAEGRKLLVDDLKAILSEKGEKGAENVARAKLVILFVFFLDFFLMFF